MALWDQGVAGSRGPDDLSDLLQMSQRLLGPLGRRRTAAGLGAAARAPEAAAVLLRRRYAVMKDAARARRR